MGELGQLPWRGLHASASQVHATDRSSLNKANHPGNCERGRRYHHAQASDAVRFVFCVLARCHCLHSGLLPSTVPQRSRRRQVLVSASSCAYTSEAQPPMQLVNRASAPSVTKKLHCNVYGSPNAPLTLKRYCRASQATAGGIIDLPSFSSLYTRIALWISLFLGASRGCVEAPQGTHDGRRERVDRVFSKSALQEACKHG